MEPRTLEAHKKSCEHWRELAALTLIQAKAIHDFESFGPYTGNCALCGLFNREDMIGPERCKGCPVSQSTGLRFCEGTNYDEAFSTWEHFVDSLTLDMSEHTQRNRLECFKIEARKELAFLESLLPKAA